MAKTKHAGFGWLFFTTFIEYAIIEPVKMDHHYSYFFFCLSLLSITTNTEVNVAIFFAKKGELNLYCCSNKNSNMKFGI